MQIKKTKTPDFNQYVGQPNQAYYSAERMEAMQKACKRALGAEGDEKLSSEVILKLFIEHPEYTNKDIFSNWGTEYIKDGKWDIEKIELGIDKQPYFKLNRMALYIKNNLVGE